VVPLEPRAGDMKPPPKTLWATGTAADGLLFWNNADIPTADLVLVVEGMTDFLAASCWASSRPDRVAILGLGSGGARGLAGVDVPRPVPLVLATDDDEAGDRYAAEVAALYRHRRVLRVHPSRLASRQASACKAAK
jgi:hypothetical protein